MNADERHAAADANEERRRFLNMPFPWMAAPLTPPPGDPWDELMKLIVTYRGQFTIESDEANRIVRLRIRLRYLGQKLEMEHQLCLREIMDVRFGLTEAAVQVMVRKIHLHIEKCESPEGLTYGH